MYKNIAKYLKKNVLLVVITICGFVLLLCTAGSDSNSIQTQKQTYDANQIEQGSLKLPANFLNNEKDITEYPKINGTEIFYKIMLSIVFIIILGAAALFMTKKFLPKIAKLQGKEIRVIETVHLGPRKSVHLLEIGSRRFLIGSTNENIRKLADLTEFPPDLTIPENEID